MSAPLTLTAVLRDAAASGHPDDSRLIEAARDAADLNESIVADTDAQIADSDRKLNDIIDKLGVGIGRLRASHDRLRDALGGLIGLLQLLENRGDVSQDLRETVRNSHRTAEALSAFAAAEETLDDATEQGRACNAGYNDALAMTYEPAVALFDAMPPWQQDAVLHVFEGIRAAFPNVNDAFVQAVQDEAYAIETEMLLLAQAPMVM